MQRILFAALVGLGLIGALTSAAQADPVDKNLGTVDGHTTASVPVQPYRRISIDRIDGSSKVDLHDLSIQEVYIWGHQNDPFGKDHGAVNGSSTLNIVRCGAVNVHLNDFVNGSSHVTIDTQGDVIIDGEINGSSTVNIIHCHSLTVTGNVAGDSHLIYDPSQIPGGVHAPDPN